MYLLKLIIATFLNLACCTLYAHVNTTSDTSKSFYFQVADVETSYPGGNEAWNKFLARNLNSNVPNKNNATIGRYTVYVIFIVDKDGSVSSVRAQTNFGFGMEDEVIRVIEIGQVDCRFTKWKTFKSLPQTTDYVCVG
jgi:hypothetical protein